MIEQDMDSVMERLQEHEDDVVLTILRHDGPIKVITRGEAEKMMFFHIKYQIGAHEHWGEWLYGRVDKSFVTTDGTRFK